MRIKLRLFLTIIMLACLQCGAWAVGYSVTWSSINSGGGVMSGAGYRVNGSVGQPTAGTAQSAGFFHWIGFWGGEMPTPTAASSINAAKMMADGSFISIVGRIATTSPADFQDRLWIEEENRTGGLLLMVSAAAINGLDRGSIVNAIGTLGTTPEGMRCLTGPIVIITGSIKPINPLGMPNRAIGGGDTGTPPLGQYGVDGGVGVNNVGLLVKTWGRVIPGDAGYLTIDDGSSTPVRIPVKGIWNIPKVGDYAEVIGISGLYSAGKGDHQRMVIPRDPKDVNP